MNEDLIWREDLLEEFRKNCDRYCNFKKNRNEVICGSCSFGKAIRITESIRRVELINDDK